MPDICADKVTATTYPPTSLYDQWTSHADELDVPVSQFIIRMVEAGRKNIEMGDWEEDSLHELRQRQAELQNELEHQRQRNKRLERQLHQTAYADIVDFIQENPGVSTPEIIQHVVDTVPARVIGHLDILEGDILQLRDSGYYSENSTTDDSVPTITDSNHNEPD